MSAYFEHLRDVHELMGLIKPEHQLLALQNLCTNNGGRWGVGDENPDNPQYLIEVQVFGVPAMAQTKEEIVKNWMMAAGNMLAAHAKEAA